MSIKKILYFKYVSIVLLYVRYSFALFLNMFNHVSVVFQIDFDHVDWSSPTLDGTHGPLSYIIAHAEFVFLLTIIIRTRC